MSIEATPARAAIEDDSPRRRVAASIGILAWNEEAVIERTLRSLFEQSVFEEIEREGACCEVVLVLNGCTDRTPDLARAVFERVGREHVAGGAIRCRVREIEVAGRNGAWNRFVHEESDPASPLLFLMDADIRFLERGTLAALRRELRSRPEADVAVDRPVKDLELEPGRRLARWISLGVTEMNAGDGPKITGQLYGIRSAVARRLLLPRDLVACEDGFLAEMVRTRCLTTPSRAERIVRAPGASHAFEAYVRPTDVLRNQKRQILGQVAVLVLHDFLGSLDERARLHLADVLRELEERDPDWLGRRIAGHARQVRRFWRLHPDLATFRFRRWRGVGGWRRLRLLGPLLVGQAITLIAAWLAARHLRRGALHYWPAVDRLGVASARPPAASG